MTAPSRHSAFGLIADDRTRLLVLGSLPGAESLKQQRYYANPGNAFWRLIGLVIARDLRSMDYEERLAVLLEHRIGLWDVVADAHRIGSLDAAIRNPRLRDLATTAASLPALRSIGFNGRTPEKFGVRQLGSAAARYRIFTLLSSSGACGRKAGIKEADWLRLRSAIDMDVPV